VIFQEKSRFVPRPYVLGLDILCDLVTGKRLLPLVLLVPWSTSGTRGLESLYDRILRQRYSILGLDSRVAASRRDATRIVLATGAIVPGFQILGTGRAHCYNPVSR
jgi:hypothetical protein